VSIERFLAQAREELVRTSPADAAAAAQRGALLVDIRPEVNRREEGEIEGAEIIERIHLEWRLDPVGSHRIGGFDANSEVIVFCNEGYASSLAARDLHRIGLPNATDLIGGYRAWRDAGLPIRPPAS
jgi:rhodanese-related sulfurtransferase